MIARTKFVSQALTGNGTANGTITVASTAGFIPGARVSLSSTAGGAEAVIVAIPNATTMVLRDVGVKGSMAGSTMVAWTTAQSAVVIQAAQQVVEVSYQELPYSEAMPVRIA